MKHKLECHFYFCGISIAKEKPYQGDLISVEKRDVRYEDQDLKNCIRIIYKNSIEGDDEVNQDFINQIILSEINLFIEALHLILINPCQLLAAKVVLNNIEVEPKYPPQPVLSGLYNLLAQRNQPKSGIQNITTVVPEFGWSMLEIVVKEFQNKSHDLKKSLALTLRWCTKGSNEFSSIDRLVAYWIAFNALYEGYGKTERQSIKNFLDKNFDLAIAERFYSTFEKQLQVLSSLKVELLGGVKISDELGNLLVSETKDIKSIINAMVLTIYGIRNNLFHGDYDPDSREAIRHIGIAERLLSEFLKEITSKQMIGYPLPSPIYKLPTTVGF
jgi:hypothetical protein